MNDLSNLDIDSAVAEMSAYGTSEGAEKGWESRPRAQKLIDDANSIDQSKAKIKLDERAGRVRIKDLHTDERGQGHASKLLSAVTNLADKHGVTLELTASPYGDEATRLDHEQLKAFYGRHGFVNEPGYDESLGYMVREPQSDVKAMADLDIAAALAEIQSAKTLPLYPPDHKVGMVVPEGGSSCLKCKHVSDSQDQSVTMKRYCDQPQFVQWNGSKEIPAAADRYCCDFFDSKE